MWCGVVLYSDFLIQSACLISKYLCPDSSFVKYRAVTRIRRSTTKQVGQEILSEVDIIHVQGDLLKQFSFANPRKHNQKGATGLALWWDFFCTHVWGRCSSSHLVGDLYAYQKKKKRLNNVYSINISWHSNAGHLENVSLNCTDGVKKPLLDVWVCFLLTLYQGAQSPQEKSAVQPAGCSQCTHEALESTNCW